MRINYFLENPFNGIALLAGEVGCGKTMVSKAVKQKLAPSQGYIPVYLQNSCESMCEIICELLHTVYKGAYPKHKLMDTFVQKSDYFILTHIEKLFSPNGALYNKKVLLIIDEAQEMDEAMLKKLKKISNLASQNKLNLLLLLCGQEEIIQNIKAIPSLEQRLDITYMLQELHEEETYRYIDFRLKKAGNQHPGLFSPMAKKLIHNSANGKPREINKFCRLCLEFAASREMTEISPELANLIIKDMTKQKTLSEQYV